MKDILGGMGGITEFEGIVFQVRFADFPADISSIPKARTWSDFISAAKFSALEFESTKFPDPFLVVYSSGTTGQPKCVLHAIGGVVLNAHKEGALHRQIGPESAQLQYTMTGSIIYMTSVQTLLMGARMIIYDEGNIDAICAVSQCWTIARRLLDSMTQTICGINRLHN